MAIFATVYYGSIDSSLWCSTIKYDGNFSIHSEYSFGDTSNNSALNCRLAFDPVNERLSTWTVGSFSGDNKVFSSGDFFATKDEYIVPNVSGTKYFGANVYSIEDQKFYGYWFANDANPLVVYESINGGASWSQQRTINMHEFRNPGVFCFEESQYCFGLRESSTSNRQTTGSSDFYSSYRVISPDAYNTAVVSYLPEGYYNEATLEYVSARNLLYVATPSATPQRTDMYSSLVNTFGSSSWCEVRRIGADLYAWGWHGASGTMRIAVSDDNSASWSWYNSDFPWILGSSSLDGSGNMNNPTIPLSHIPVNNAHGFLAFSQPKDRSEIPGLYWFPTTTADATLTPTRICDYNQFLTGSSTSSYVSTPYGGAAFYISPDFGDPSLSGGGPCGVSWRDLERTVVL